MSMLPAVDLIYLLIVLMSLLTDDFSLQPEKPPVA